MKHRKPNKIRLTISERTGRYSSPLNFNWSSWSIERRFDDSRLYCEVMSGSGYPTEGLARKAGNANLKNYREAEG